MPTDPSQSRLTQHQQARQEVRAQPQSVHEFASVEDLLRADRLQHPPPPQLEARLRQRLTREPPPRRWWQRWWRR